MLIILVQKHCVFAQQQTTHQKLIWYGYYINLKIDDKWYIQSEIQERHFIDPFAQHQSLIRTHLHRILGASGWETCAGLAFFMQHSNDPYKTSTLTVPELRPHIEFAYKQKWKSITFDHRYRAEARFYHHVNEDKTDLEKGYEFSNFRFRYKLQVSIPLWKMDDKRSLKLKVSDEIHLNTIRGKVENVFDQNRIYLGINIDILPNLSFETGYMKFFQQRPSDDYFSRDVLNFTVNHRINLKK